MRAADELDPATSHEVIEQLVKKFLVDNVKSNDPNFEETSKQLASKLSAIVQAYQAIPDVSPQAATNAQNEASEAFEEIFTQLKPSPRSAWRAAQTEFKKGLAEKKFRLKTAIDWSHIYAATAKGLALASVEQAAVAVEIAGGFWKKQGDENGATYWDERFEESAGKLATRIDAVADNESLSDSTAIQRELVKEFNAFLAEIHNEQVPEKKATWTDLILAWRERLVKSRQEGTLNAASPEALRGALREAAKDLRKAGQDWTTERTRNTENQSGNRGGTQAAGGGSSGTFYGTPHHARAIRRIHGRHAVRMARIQGINGQ